MFSNFLVVFFAVVQPPVFGQYGETTRPDAELLQAWLAELSDPSFEVRENAVKKLYAAGPAALKALTKVTEGDDYEAALRARSIIERIQKLFLVGAHIELSASNSSFRWNEPVSLRVKFINPSDFPIHLPFLISNRSVIDQDALARQVGTLLDAADFLVVRDGDGQLIDLTVDDPRGDEQLTEAIETRAYDAPASLLAPHGTFELRLKEFNRGFARFRMLRKGTYSVRFSYIPEWDDPTLRTRQIAKVQSNELTLNVTESAPNVVLSGGRALQVSLQNENDQLTVRLTAAHDRPLGVNLNLGDRRLDHHAHLSWLLRSGRRSNKKMESFEQTPLLTDKIRTLKPGEAVVLHRAKVGDILQLFDAPEAAHSVMLAVEYASLLDRPILKLHMKNKPGLEKTLKALHDTLPLVTFSGSIQSDFVELNR